MAESPKKSILDGVKVLNNAFKSHSDYKECDDPDSKKYYIVGKCAVCGSPIYGRHVLSETDDPCLKRTCSHYLMGGTMQIETK